LADAGDLVAVRCGAADSPSLAPGFLEEEEGEEEEQEEEETAAAAAAAAAVLLAPPPALGEAWGVAVAPAVALRGRAPGLGEELEGCLEARPGVLAGFVLGFSGVLVHFFLLGSAAPVAGLPASLGSSFLKEAAFFSCVPGLEPGNGAYVIHSPHKLCRRVIWYS